MAGREVILKSNSTIIGPLWFTGWLFTLGFLKLAFWKGVLALVVWPYFIGAAVGGG
jgi:hypothetical protein